MPKLDFKIDAEYVIDLVKCQYVDEKVQQCVLLHGYAIHA